MTRDDLIRLIEESGEDWLLRDAAGREGVGQVRERLDDAYAAYRAKFPHLEPGDFKFNDDALLEESVANPHRVRAVLQAIGASSPMMVALVWRIIQGDRILRIGMQYGYPEEFELHVTIKNDVWDHETDFDFDRIEDAAFLRHLSIVRSGDEQMFDGYYALNLTK